MDLRRQGVRPKGPRAEVGLLRPQLGGLGSAVSSPSGVQGEALAAKGLSCILNTQDDLSGQQDYGPRRFYFFWLPDRVVGPKVVPEQKR